MPPGSPPLLVADADDTWTTLAGSSSRPLLSCYATLPVACTYVRLAT
jgi:hypothetical protein